MIGWQIYDWFGNKLPAQGGSSQGGSFQVDRIPRYFTVAAPPKQVANLLDTGSISGRLNIDARLLPTASKTAGQGTSLNLLVHNESGAAQTVALTFGGILGGYVGDSAAAAQLKLKANEQRLIKLPLLGLPVYRTLLVSARAGGAIINFPFHFALAEAVPVTSIEALAEAPGHSFNFDLVRSGAGNRMSEADFTPKFQVGYDANNLYLSATVMDDLLAPAKAKIVAGQNDQIHFQIASATPQRKASANLREAFARIPGAADVSIVIAPTGANTALAELRRPAGSAKLTGKLANATAEKTPDGYRVAVAMPWTKLGMTAPKSGESLVFNVVAYDADGVNPDHKTEWPWAGGPNFDENPAGWGELSFG